MAMLVHVQHRRLVLLGALISYVAVTVSWGLALRYSRIKREGVEPYLGTTVVFLSECCKLIVWTSALVWQQDKSLRIGWNYFKSEIIFNPKESVKMLLPSILYMIQNNLVFVALTNLDTGTYLVMRQLKIPATAFFSVVMLGRKVSLKQIVALIILAIGVILVQFPQMIHQAYVRDDIGLGKNTGHKSYTANLQELDKIKGLVAVLCISCLSGFSGVYYEKMVKTGAQPSVVIRNIQMGFPSILFALFAMVISDYSQLASGGFFQLYSPIMASVILLQAFGGMTIAVTINYANSITKEFASAISIIVGCLSSYVLLDDLELDFNFLTGTSLVIMSIFVYSGF